MQPDSVPVLVYELDAIHAVRAPRRAADLMHQLEQHSGIDLRRQPMGVLHAEMQYDESLQSQAHEYRDAETFARKALGLDPPNSYAQQALQFASQH